jgi:hypothetical protein
MLLACVTAARGEYIQSGSWRGEATFDRTGMFTGCHISSSECLGNSVDQCYNFGYRLTFTTENLHNIKLRVHRERYNQLDKDPWKLPLQWRVTTTTIVSLLFAGTPGDEKDQRKIFERSYQGDEEYDELGFLNVDFTVRHDDPILDRLGEADELEIHIEKPVNWIARVWFKPAFALPFVPKQNDASQALIRVKKCVDQHRQTS